MLKLLKMKQQSATLPVSRASFGKMLCHLSLSAVLVLSSVFVLAESVSARDFEAEIRRIQTEIDQYQAKAGELRSRADNFQRQLDTLTNQKAIIQAQINIKQAEHDQLVADIAANEAKIIKNQDALGDTIADLYVDGDISALEMIASSKNIGEYVDKQEYRSSIRDALKTKIDQIKQLKKKLEQQQKDVERVIADQQLARDELARKEAEQQTLVNQTRGEEAAYRNLTANREQQKLQVQKEQDDLIKARMQGAGMLRGGGSLGSYAAWAGDCYVDGNAMSHGGAGGGGEDPWGYGCNQCVSYAAWKTYQVTGYAAKYWGNANMWPNSARGKFTVSSQPRAKALGVISSGEFGHIVYIENYNPAANTVDISQYNEWLPEGGWGQYSTRSGVPAGRYDKYIYLD